MKKILLGALLALFGVVGKSHAIFISTTVSSTTLVSNFAASPVISLNPHESMDYSIAGVSTGTYHLEKSFDGYNFIVIFSSVDAGSNGTLRGTEFAGEIPTLYRFRVSTMTYGTYTFTLRDNDDFVGEIRNNKRVPSLTFTDERLSVPKLTFTPTGDTAISLSTSTTLTTYTFPRTFMIVTSTGGAITVGSLPTISTTTAQTGDMYIIQSTTATVTLSDNDSVAGTLLELGSTSRALGVGDILVLIYRAGKWWEMGFYNN